MLKSKKYFQSVSRAVALEPRLLFDGAGAVAAADAWIDADTDTAHRPDVIASRETQIERSYETDASEADSAPILVIVDSRVPDYQQFLDGLPGNVVVRVVDANESGVNAVEEVLRGANEFAAVHIISHGNRGEIELGNELINANFLSDNAARVSGWANHLSQNADILLYGCDVGAGAAGNAFVTQLATLTTADVAASTDATGNAAQGGDWALERHSGVIEAELIVTQAQQQGYSALLAGTQIVDVLAEKTRDTVEDTAVAITGISISDSNNPAQMTVQIKSTGGIATIGSLSGANISNGSNNSADFTLTGSLAQLNAALATLSYTPEADKNSSTTGFTPKIEIIATDVSNGGAPTNLTINNLSVSSANDAPDLSTQIKLTVNEGDSQAFSLAQLANSANSLDVDIATGQQQLVQQMVVINSLPAHGKLLYNGAPIGVGTVIPASELANLAYQHDGTDIQSATADKFDITVSDGGGGQTSGSINIEILPKNVAPVISGDIELIEGQVKAVMPTLNLGDSADNLSNAKITISDINNDGQGTLFIDANNNNRVDAGEALSGTTVLTAQQAQNLNTQLKFAHNGAEPNDPVHNGVSYKITVEDSGGAAGNPLTTSKVVDVKVIPNNDDPTLTNGHGTAGTAKEVVEHSTTVLGTGDISISDVDRLQSDPNSLTPDGRLVVTVESVPAQGNIQLNVGGTWVNLGEGGRFTMDDLKNGRVRYVQTTDIPDNPSTGTQDKFTFSVRDSSFGFDVWTDPANPSGGREGGVRDTPTDPSIKVHDFFINVKPVVNDTNHNDPADPTPGYGGNNMSYEFAKKADSTNGTTGWNEANVSSPGGGQCH